MTRRGVLAVAIGALVAACAGGTPAPSAPSAPSSGAPNPSGSAHPTIIPTSWAGDLALIDTTVRQFHPAPFTIHPESEWTARLADVSAEIESASENEQVTLVASLVGLLDTHSGLYSIPGGWHFYGVLPYRFSDGWFVVNADSPKLIGDEVVSIGGVPIEDVVTRLAPLVPHDNPTGLLGNILWEINSVEYLNGAGIVRDTEHPGFVLRTPDGGSVTEEPNATPEQQYTLPSPGYLTGRAPEAVKRRAERIWTKVDTEHRVFLISVNDYGDMVAAGQAMTAAFDAKQVDRVVFDMRYLQGGSGDIGILDTIKADKRVNRPAGLTVLIGRENYSAATSVAEFFDRETEAVFVGEPTPARADNFRCDCHDFQLPHSGFWLTVPTWYDRFNDDRPEITPDVPMALSSADFFAGRDPVLDAALSGKLPGR
jgi:hypothetical protein